MQDYESASDNNEESVDPNVEVRFIFPRSELERAKQLAQIRDTTVTQVMRQALAREVHISERGEDPKPGEESGPSA